MIPNAFDPKMSINVPIDINRRPLLDNDDVVFLEDAAKDGVEDLQEAADNLKLGDRDKPARYAVAKGAVHRRGRRTP